MANRILLLGAGFSSNWGGPLASEMFDALLEEPEVNMDTELRRILWEHKDAGGFENALARVQEDARLHPGTLDYMRRLDALQAAIDHIFARMDRGFAARPSWEFTNDRARLLLATFVR